MEKIDKFELMLMDSNINILGLPDGAVEQIVELMAKCYTTRNEEVVSIVEMYLNNIKLSAKVLNNIDLLTDLLTKLKEDKK